MTVKFILFLMIALRLSTMRHYNLTKAWNNFLRFIAIKGVGQWRRYM